MTAEPALVLHIWPGRWSLPSIDQSCLEAVLLLQLTCPGRFSIVETVNPDSSPSGHLPFLTHHQNIVSSLPSIISYITSLNRRHLEDEDMELMDLPINLHLDAGLPPKILAQRTAWRSYIETHLGDLLAHSFFVLEPNYPFTHSTYASMLPFPQRYYVPNRIRDTYKPRLQAVGLWDEGDGLTKLGSRIYSREESKDKIRQSFAQAQLKERATPVFDILTNLVNRKHFLSADRPTTIDVALAARILLLMNTPLPNQTLKNLLLSSYSSLVDHAALVREIAFPADAPSLHIIQPSHPNLLQLINSSSKHLARRITTREFESEEDARFRKYRWGWYALAVTGIVGYYLVVGLPIVIVVRDNSSKSGESEKDEKESSEEYEEENQEDETEIGIDDGDDTPGLPVDDEPSEDSGANED